MRRPGLSALTRMRPERPRQKVRVAFAPSHNTFLIPALAEPLDAEPRRERMRAWMQGAGPASVEARSQGAYNGRRKVGVFRMMERRIKFRARSRFPTLVTTFTCRAIYKRLRFRKRKKVDTTFRV